MVVNVRSKQYTEKNDRLYCFATKAINGNVRDKRGDESDTERYVCPILQPFPHWDDQYQRADSAAYRRFYH